MNQERLVAAIEICSSKIICAVGRYDGQGQLSVIAVEQEECKDIVRYGIVRNLEETALKVSRILDKLQRNPNIRPRKITGLFVGLSGLSLRSISNEVSITLPDEMEITDEIIARLRHDALKTDIDSSLEVVDAVARLYTVGKNETSSPKGMIGREISVIYDIIVCRPEIKRNLRIAIQDKAGINIEGYFVTPLAAGHIVLSTEEKRLGCMLVDMGAETTEVSIYKSGCLNYFVTLPLGGRNITRDLISLSLLEERAEEIKITNGNALAKESASTLNIHGIRRSDISNYIVARTEEIVANIVEQITYANIKPKDLPGGIVCIGAAANLNGMIELLARQSGMNVRLGHLPDYIHTSGLHTPGYEMLEVDCILYEGATFSDARCLSEPEKEEIPHTGQTPEVIATINEKEASRESGSDRRREKMRGLFRGFNDRISKIFAPPVDDDDENDILD
ncbi:MAG: cell division protein FtsA [Muribaculaceae bacterium]|nr:cell division protein FtsA [Muribaculaceae bacterium]